MMYTCNNETSRSYLRRTRRRKRAKMLQYTRRLRARGGICIPEGADSICEGLDLSGRDKLVASTADTNIHILGRSPQSTGLLQGQSTHIVTGSGLRLFMPSLDSRIGTSTQLLDMLVKSPHIVQLRKRFASMKAVQAIHYLNYSFSADRNLIVLNGFHTMPQKLLKEFPSIERLYANEIGPLHFYGGPPNKPGWYKGTLLTLLMDKVLLAASEGNTGLLERFLNVQL